MKKTGVAIALVIAACLGTGAAPSPNSCSITVLPPAVAKRVGAIYPGWQIVSEAQMDPDDAAYWGAHHPTWCPGLVEGRFSEASADSWAMALFARSGDSYREVVLLAWLGSDGRTASMSLTGPMRTKEILVISKVPPGTYQASEEGGTVKIRTDGVLLELPESATKLLYVDKGIAKSIVLSE